MDYNLINDNIELKYKIENENVDINLLKDCYDNINKLKLINYDNLANSLIKTLNCNNNIKKVVKIVALTIANTFCPFLPNSSKPIMTISASRFQSFHPS